MTLPSRAWSAIRQSAAAYCDRAVNAYDDAIHALQNAPPAGIHAANAAGRQGSSLPPRALEPGWLTNSYPRCVHVGRCGGLSFRLETTLGSAEEAAAACNVTRDALDFAAVCVYVDNKGGLCGSAASLCPASWPRLSAPKCHPGHPLALVKPARRHWPNLGGPCCQLRCGWPRGGVAGRLAASLRPLPRRPWTLGASGESTRACACAASASRPRPPAPIS